MIFFRPDGKNDLNGKKSLQDFPGFGGAPLPAPPNPISGQQLTWLPPGPHAFDFGPQAFDFDFRLSDLTLTLTLTFGFWI